MLTPRRLPHVQHRRGWIPMRISCAGVPWRDRRARADCWQWWGQRGWWQSRLRGSSWRRRPELELRQGGRCRFSVAGSSCRGNGRNESCRMEGTPAPAGVSGYQMRVPPRLCWPPQRRSICMVASAATYSEVGVSERLRGRAAVLTLGGRCTLVCVCTNAVCGRSRRCPHPHS